MKSVSGDIVPIILCGGSGTRLWPLSRKSFPKQFASLTGDKTLFQESAERLSGDGFSAPVILTNAEFRFVVQEQLEQAGIMPEAILIEPEARNTAPAILTAALHVLSTTPDALLLVAPSDHVVPDKAAFQAAIRAGACAARDGRLVTFGIMPTHAETGYGYLELEAPPTQPDSFEPVSLKQFVEKPDAARAKQMLEAGYYLWNAGIFLFSAKAIVAAFETHAVAMIAPVRASLQEAEKDLGFLRLSPAPWCAAEAISIDYAIMEKARNLSVVPYGAGWSDLGGWDAVWREMPQDASGVATSGAATAIDCRNTLLRSEDEGLEMVGIGLENLIAIAMPDAVLIADVARSQDVRLAVSRLKAKGAKQAEAFAKDRRPWGWFETLALGNRFQVKRIVVKPGHSLSLQSHHHRAEHWVVVEGTAQVTIGNEVQLVCENQSVYIPIGTVHRLENPGKLPVVLIEVQTGSYLGDDDIIRYEDRYARG